MKRDISCVVLDVAYNVLHSSRRFAFGFAKSFHLALSFRTIACPQQRLERYSTVHALTLVTKVAEPEAAYSARVAIGCEP